MPEALRADVVGFWDFARGIGGEEIHDLSSHDHRGEIVQLPTRAVTGWRWDGSEQDWKRAPSHYGAIHFHEDDLVDAGWDSSATLMVPGDWKSGVYALRVELDGDSDSIPFFVLPSLGSSRNRVHFLASTATYAAYANQTLHLAPGIFGDGEVSYASDATLLAHPEYGRSLYCHHSDGSGVHYSSLRHPVMNFRPEGMLWSFHADLDIVAWLEAVGMDYDVGTDDDLHLQGESVLPEGGVVVTGTHPEYWSTPMRDALERWLEGGGRLIYMGGNGFYWRIAFHPTRSDAIEVRRAEDGTRAWISEPGEYYQAWGRGEYGGLWRRLGRPPNDLVGVGFAAQGFEEATFYRRTEASHDPRVSFLFEGVQSEGVIGDYGSLGGAAGQEIDRYDERLQSPPHALVVASSEAHPPSMLRVKEEFFATTPLGKDPNVRADLCFFETAAGGAVLSTGSIAWASSLAHENYENDVARITTNALRRFADPWPFSRPTDPQSRSSASAL